MIRLGFARIAREMPFQIDATNVDLFSRIQRFALIVERRLEKEEKNVPDAEHIISRRLALIADTRQ